MTAKLNTARAIKGAISLLLAVSCVAVVSWFSKHRPETARRHWKDAAIPSISGWAEDKNWRVQEIGTLTNRLSGQGVLEEGWLTDKMILMESGEWLVYKSHCAKEAPHLVKDIFLATGSDGKWYYSTFHFCVGMVALRGEQETQPLNLAMFVHEYNLREFDGRSDECLKETGTWPASWREKKESP